MNYKKIIYLIPIFYISLSNTSNSATTSQLKSVLEKYGVPYTSDCGTLNEAHFNGSKPECQQLGMFYNKSKRRCEPCPLGTATDTKTDTSCKDIVCPNGNVGTIINDGKCPAGYVLQQITGGSCPMGNVLEKM